MGIGKQRMRGSRLEGIANTNWNGHHLVPYFPLSSFSLSVGTERISSGTPTATSERKICAILFWVNEAEQARVIQRRPMEKTLACRGIPLPSR